MKRRIRHTVTYLFFLSIGVGLFYLATLDVTRGSLSAETASTSFEVGRGLAACESGQTIRLAPAEARLENKAYRIVQVSSQQPDLQGIFGSDSDEWCLEKGTYLLVQETFEEGDIVILEGIDKTGILADDMRKASWPGILLSVVFGYLAIISRGMRWLILLEPMGYRANTWRSIHAVAFSYFANTFVPRSGELARCVALNQTDNIPVDRLFGTVISERIVDFLMLLIITALAFFTNLEAFNTLLSGREADTESSGIPGLLLWLALLGGLFLLLFFLLRRTVLLRGFYNKIIGFISGMGEGVKSVLKSNRKGQFLLHTFAIWLLYFGASYAIFLSISDTADLPMHHALFIMVAGGFGMVIPAPGGIGSYHWLIKLAFIALGFSGTLGFAVANVLWLSQTVMMIVGGAFGYLALMWFKIRRDRRNLVQDEA